VKHAEIPARNRTIRARHAVGVTVSVLSAEYGLKERQIYLILSPGERRPGRPKLARALDHAEALQYRKMARATSIEEARAAYDV